MIINIRYAIIDELIQILADSGEPHYNGGIKGDSFCREFAPKGFNEQDLECLRGSLRSSQ